MNGYVIHNFSSNEELLSYLNATSNEPISIWSTPANIYVLMKEVNE